MLKLEGKTVLVTGGNSGIGLAIARRFVQEGAHVFITARREAQLANAVADIGGQIDAIPCDLTKTDDLTRLLTPFRQKPDVSTFWSTPQASPSRRAWKRPRKSISTALSASTCVRWC